MLMVQSALALKLVSFDDLVHRGNVAWGRCFALIWGTRLEVSPCDPRCRIRIETTLWQVWNETSTYLWRLSGSILGCTWNTTEKTHTGKACHNASERIETVVPGPTNTWKPWHNATERIEESVPGPRAYLPEFVSPAAAGKAPRTAG